MAPSTRSAVLDAALTVLGNQRLSRLSLEQVATTAGVSRQTVYRHFGSRAGLIEAVVVREEERLLEALAEAVADVEDLCDALTAAIARMLAWVQAHPLMPRLLATDAEVLVPLLTTGRGPVLAVARPFVEQILRDRLPAGAEVGAAADLLTRVMVSYAVTAPDQPADQAARSLATLLVRGLPGP